MIVELVKVGTQGTIVALVYLFIKYLDKKGARPDPRDALWLAFAIVLAAIAAVIFSTWIESRKPVSRLSVESDAIYEGQPYVVEHSVFDADLSGWKPVLPKRAKEKVSPVVITRRDLIRKASANDADYSYEFWTGGLGIDAESLLGFPKPEFSDLKTEVNADGTTRKLYKLRLPIGTKPNGTELPMFTRFRFWNSFQKSEGEDWRARIEYPTRALSVAIRFPASKKVTKIEAFLGDSDGKKIPGRRALSDDNPVLLDLNGTGSQAALWAGLNIPGKHVVLFEWKWENR